MAKTSTFTAEDGCTFWSDGHLCERGVRHCDRCMCKCGHRWDRVSEVVEPEPRTITLSWTSTSSPELESAILAWLRRRPGEDGGLG